MAFKKKSLYFLFLLMMFCMVSSGMINAQRMSPEEQLTQYIDELQLNPDDNALRENIIKLALTLDPPPAVPEAAKRSMARGIAAIKSANESGGFTDAVAEFQKAALTAPWLANVYNNLGIAQDKAGQYEEAISSLKLYLLAAPFANDADEVKSLIYEIEYRQEKAAGELSEEELKMDDEGPEQKQYEWLQGLWNYRSEIYSRGSETAIFTKVVEFSQEGDVVEGYDLKELNPQEGPLFKAEVSENGLQWQTRVYDQRADKFRWISISVNISNDQKTITYSFPNSGSSISVTLTKE